MGKQYDHGNWIAQSKHDIPDFMIIGAMKSGTTTLHEMLNRHPDIAIPRGELFFFLKMILPNIRILPRAIVMV
ncbi:sulfotransferase [Pseudoalteromonas xiamenensis]